MPARTGAEGIPIGGFGGHEPLKAFPCISQKDSKNTISAA